MRRVRFLGVMNRPGKVLVDGEQVNAGWEWDGGSKVLDVSIGRVFDGGFVVQYS